MKTKNLLIPDDWFVFEAGQSIIDKSWFVNLVNQSDIQNKKRTPRQIKVEKKTSFSSALTEAIENIPTN
jgi:hypothetical protein